MLHVRTALLLSAGLSASASFASGLTAGDILVYQVGNGTTSLTSAAAPVFLDEYTTSGTLVESIAVPTTSVNGGNQALTESGSASSDGLLTLSPNGQYVTFTGYDAAVGTTSVVNGSSNRTIGIIGASGVVNTTTSANIDSGNNIRSAVTSNGTALWSAGSSGGVYALTAGSSTATLVNNTPARQVTIFNGQLYFDSSSTLYSLGSGLPTTAATATALPGVSTSGSPYSFVFESLKPSDNGAADTLYIADSSAGIVKYSLVNSNWVKTGTVGSGSDDFTGLSAEVVGGAVELFGIEKTAINALVEVTDTSGYDGTLSGSLTTLATAGTNEAFDGVAITPVPVPAAFPLLLSGLAGLGLMRGRGRRS